MCNISMKVIYDLSVYLMIFVDGIQMSNQGHKMFKDLYLMNNAFCDDSFMKYIYNVYSMSYMAIQFIS